MERKSKPKSPKPIPNSPSRIRTNGRGDSSLILQVFTVAMLFTLIGCLIFSVFGPTIKEEDKTVGLFAKAIACVLGVVFTIVGASVFVMHKFGISIYSDEDEDEGEDGEVEEQKGEK